MSYRAKMIRRKMGMPVATATDNAQADVMKNVAKGLREARQNMAAALKAMRDAPVVSTSVDAEGVVSFDQAKYDAAMSQASVLKGQVTRARNELLTAVNGVRLAGFMRRELLRLDMLSGEYDKVRAVAVERGDAVKVEILEKAKGV